MHRDSLIWFFNENGLDPDAGPPAAAIEHFHIKLLTSNSSLQDTIESEVLERLPQREAEISEDRDKIRCAATCDEVVRLMRSGTDIMNQHLLVKKALEFEDEIIPKIIKMLKTSLNDLFIEASIRVLAICKGDVSEDLIAIYDEIRNPYAQSLVLVALGFKADEKHIPWFMKQYKELKQLYPEESHCYGAFYALIEMDDRFYHDSRRISGSHGADDHSS